MRQRHRLQPYIQVLANLNRMALLDRPLSLPKGQGQGIVAESVDEPWYPAGRTRHSVNKSRGEWKRFLASRFFPPETQIMLYLWK